MSDFEKKCDKLLRMAKELNKRIDRLLPKEVVEEYHRRREEMEYQEDYARAMKNL